MRDAQNEQAFVVAIERFDRATQKALSAIESYGYRAVTTGMRKTTRDALAPEVVSALEAWDEWFDRTFEELRAHPVSQCHRELSRRSAAETGTFFPYDICFAHAVERCAIVLCRDYLQLLKDLCDQAERRL